MDGIYCNRAADQLEIVLADNAVGAVAGYAERSCAIDDEFILCINSAGVDFLIADDRGVLIGAVRKAVLRSRCQRENRTLFIDADHCRCIGAGDRHIIEIKLHFFCTGDDQLSV